MKTRRRLSDFCTVWINSSNKNSGYRYTVNVSSENCWVKYPTRIACDSFDFVGNLKII